MNEAQLHLLTNHLPVMGSLFTVLLLLWGLIRKSDEIKRSPWVRWCWWRSPLFLPI